MDDEKDNGNKIIGLPETIFITLLVGMEELVEFLILVITLGTGIIVVEIMDGVVGAGLEMYMALRGGRGIVKWVVEPIGAFINGISLCLLPGKTIATLAGIWAINHSEKIEKKLNVIGKSAGGSAIAGGVVAGGIARTGAATQPTTAASEPNASTARQRIEMVTRGGPKMPIKK